MMYCGTLKARPPIVLQPHDIVEQCHTDELQLNLSAWGIAGFVGGKGNHAKGLL